MSCNPHILNTIRSVSLLHPFLPVLLKRFRHSVCHFKAFDLLHFIILYQNAIYFRSSLPGTFNGLELTNFQYNGFKCGLDLKAR